MAKVNRLTKLQRGSYGIASIDNELMICQGTTPGYLHIVVSTRLRIIQLITVLTMYEKGGGKVARHAWTGECHNIGLLSYLVVQLWRQSLGQRCLFKAIHGASSHLALPRFAHIPSAAFLYAIPIGFASRTGKDITKDITINAHFIDTIFGQLLASKSSITASVHTLQAKSSLKDEDT